MCKSSYDVVFLQIISDEIWFDGVDVMNDSKCARKKLSNRFVSEFLILAQ
jgi:hypothetical protein